MFECNYNTLFHNFNYMNVLIIIIIRRIHPFIGAVFTYKYIREFINILVQQIFIIHLIMNNCYAKYLMRLRLACVHNINENDIPRACEMQDAALQNEIPRSMLRSSPVLLWCGIRIWSTALSAQQDKPGRITQPPREFSETLINHCYTEAGHKYEEKVSKVKPHQNEEPN